MDLEKIEELIGALESSRASELTVKSGEARVRIRRGEPKPRAASPPAQHSPRKEQGAPPEHAVGEALIRAPIVGLFHSVEGLCEVGASVRAGQTVGAIESMKLLNDIVSDVSGEVVESMVEDGVPVEYNQVLCKIKLA